MMLAKHLRAISSIFLFAFIGSTPALGSVELRFSPADQTLPLGNSGSLAIMIDDSLEVRTIEVRAAYDPAVLLSMEGYPGDLFTESGCQLFTDYDDSTPGEWYGAAVIIGASCWITDPGELYVWEFEGIAPGFSTVMTLSVRLFDPAANLIADVNLPSTYVFVGDGTAAQDAVRPAPHLDLYPNPFNPSVQLSISGPAGPARLDVLDIRGRHLRELWRGELPAEALQVHWDGRSTEGSPLPSGIYLFRLELASGVERIRRGILIK